MRVFGTMLVILGLLWIVMCYLGTAMMSRGVDWFTEALLPALIGVALIGFGSWLFARGARRAREKAASQQP